MDSSPYVGISFAVSDSVCALLCSVKHVCHMAPGQSHYCICLLQGEDRVLLLQHKRDVCRPTALYGFKQAKPSQDQSTPTHPTDAWEIIHNTFKPLGVVCYAKKLTNTKPFHIAPCSVINTTPLKDYNKLKMYHVWYMYDKGITYVCIMYTIINFMFVFSHFISL